MLIDTEYRQGVDTYSYDVRKVILKVIDAKKESLIWRATASFIVDPANQAEQIREVVAQIRENFPPKQKR